MKLNKILFPILGLSAVLSLQSCADNDFKELNSDVIGTKNFDIKTEYFNVTTQNKTIKAIRTNGLSAYQLGEYSQAPFGKTNASIISQLNLPEKFLGFGNKSQKYETDKNEDEQETVVSVKLNIPFFSTAKKSQKTEDGKTHTIYKLDSIYGSKSANFDIDIDEYQYYLRNIDNELENPQAYYSNFEIDKSLIGEKLAAKKGVTISDKEIVNYNFDNPLTADKDESKEELSRVPPMLSIELDKDFFQRKILDMEGHPELSSQSAFHLFFKGMIIKTSNFSDDLMMLLNFSNAKVEIVYKYNISKDGKNYNAKAKVEFPLSGIKINKFSYENDNVDNSSKEKIFLQGGKHFAEMTFFTEKDINRIKSENWLINDAILSFEVDKNSAVKNIPQRIYIYDAKTGNPLADYNIDASNPNNPYKLPKHLKPYNKYTNRYEIHIPNYITNIIKKGNKNITLGLVVAQDVSQEAKRTKQGEFIINHVAPTQYLKNDDSLGKTTTTTATTPLSVVLYGSDNSVSEDHRLRLKITYTKPTK